MSLENETLDQLCSSVENIADELATDGLDVFGWLNEQLSVQAIIFRPEGEFLGAEIICAYGGPSIYVDTRTSEVKGYWGSDTHIVQYADNNHINDRLEEIYARND